MSHIVIEPTRNGVLARVAVVELSAIDGIYTLSCTGDATAHATGEPAHECPTAGFDPSDHDTWSDRDDCISAAEVHMDAHERQFCEECGGLMSLPVHDTDEHGRTERRACTVCKHVEELS